MRFTLATPVEIAARPKGIGTTALALGAFIFIYLVQALIRPFGGAQAASIFERLLVGVSFGLAVLIVWLYWKGQDWGRILVLLWSFAIAAKEISAFIDRNGDLTSLMSQPVRFAQAIMAIFLLYFLNTRAVRAWFKKMSASAADLIADHLVGKLCTAVERDGSSDVWRVAFEHDAELTLHCPWRIVLDDNLAFASTPAPEIAPGGEMPWQLVQNLRVKAVRVAPRTSDLFVSFEMGIELQSWSNGSRTQQWRYSDPLLTVVADAEGLTSQAIAAPLGKEEPDSND